MKAATCIAPGNLTKALGAEAEGFDTWLEGIRHVVMLRLQALLIAGAGGVIIRDGDGSLLGEAGHQDEALALPGIEAAELVAQAE